MFDGTNTIHATVNTQLRKGVVKVLIIIYTSTDNGYPGRQAASATGVPPSAGCTPSRVRPRRQATGKIRENRKYVRSGEKS